MRTGSCIRVLCACALFMLTGGSVFFTAGCSGGEKKQEPVVAAKQTKTAETAARPDGGKTVAPAPPAATGAVAPKAAGNEKPEIAAAAGTPRALGMAGPGKTVIVGGAAPTKEDEAIILPLRENAEALNEKNVDKYMATVHPNAHGYSTTRDAAKKLFGMPVTYKYEIADAKVIKKTGDEARVRAVVITTSGSGVTAHITRFTTLHVIKKYQGKWRIFKTLKEGAVLVK